MRFSTENRYQNEWANLCSEFDLQSKEKVFLSDEEIAGFFAEYNGRVTRLLLSYRYERDQSSGSCK